MFRRGSYANVASTLALIVALGGTSYAAVAIPKNSVGSKQIVNSSVKSKDVKNGTLKSVDFKAGQLPAGATGPAGPAGPAGPQGPAGPSHAFGFSSSDTIGWAAVPDEPVVLASLNLPAGSYAVTGKALANNNDAVVVDTICWLDLGAVTIDNPAKKTLSVGTASEADRGFFVVAGVGTLAAPGQASLVCSASSASGNWPNYAITAVKVGSVG
ncbi:hypothetical protein GCM10011376_27370 [Nocardioides flavus (ex Wang et al. 2016)]|uniref:Collagen triple helix repeat-containing protein n=1 Tax=Nocardioides flavus (ex Wang et al. 2016) TaxID=2058780 RepID=A0ABQ3HN85_9ACTN|nr:hypothetical protein [Nocardioides flavus (ex Wang et al. 2016)]GHE18127.1 hypothetical protein GCM10011376_27370 [Nocardioides flavus (ex Wang et al. 2016)]